MKLRFVKEKDGDCANPGISRLEKGVLCTCGCFLHCAGCSINIGRRRRVGPSYSLRK